MLSKYNKIKLIFQLIKFVLSVSSENSIEYRVYSEEDTMRVISGGWHMVIADRKSSIEYRFKKKREKKV